MLFCSSTHWTSHLSALQVTFDRPCCTFCVSEIPDSVLIVGLKPELMHALTDRCSGSMVGLATPCFIEQK
jgi:hypothetical protein